MIHLGRLDPDGALELTREVFADGTAAGRRLRALGPGYCLLEREGVSRWRLSGVSLGTSGTQVRRALATLPAPVAPTATSAPTASSSAPSVEISPQPTPAEPVREVPAPTARRRPWLGLGPLDAPAVEPPAARITVAVPPGFGKVARGTVPSAPKAAAPSPAPAPPPVAVPVPTASAPPRSTRAPKRSTVKPAPRRPAPRPRVEAPPVDDAIRAAVHGAVAEVFEVLRAELAATLARVEARFRGGGATSVMRSSLTTLEGVRGCGSSVLPLSPTLALAPPFERRGVLGEDSMWIQEPGSVRSSVEAFARLISMVLVYFGQRRSPGTRERLDAMLVSYQELIAGLTLPVVGRALADYAAAHLAADALVLAVVGGSHHSLGGAEAALFSEATARSVDDPTVPLRESAEALRAAAERARAAAGPADPIVDRQLGQLAFDLAVAATRVVLAPPAPLSTRPPPAAPAGEEECDATA